MLRKFFKILRNIVLILLGIIIVFFAIINTSWVQDMITKRTVTFLSEQLQTKVELQKIRFKLLNRASIEGLYIEDLKGDTLAYIGDAELKITDWFIFHDEPSISYIGFKDAFFNVYQDTSNNEWNIKFLVDAIARPEKPKEKQSSSLNFNFKRINLEQVRFIMANAQKGSDLEGKIGKLELSVKDIDRINKTISIHYIKSDFADLGIMEYTGLLPIDSMVNNYEELAEKTPFNTHGWKVDLNELDIESGRFFIEHRESIAPEGLFDAQHLDIRDITIQASNLSIINDTIFAQLNHLQAIERSGLAIKKMSAQITVSPNISECKDLYLETNNSIITDYYAMKYDHFPDFTNYIENVNMEANLLNSEVGIQDIAYFSENLKRFKNFSLHVSGSGKGTVDRLYAKDLFIEDGISSVKGNLSMNGLPDITKTFIDFNEIELHTSGVGSFIYFPQLARQTIANIKDLSQVEFKGNFTGFLSDFVAFGDFKTNLGNATADINMKIPKEGSPLYSGNLSSSGFNIGILFDQDFVGESSFKAEIKGQGFAQKNVTLDVDGFIEKIDLNEYVYQNIQIQGQLQKRNFDGFLHVDDPNLYLNFIGKADFSNPERNVFDFKATLDSLNTRNLKWTDQELKIKGEIESKFVGTSIDDFIGSALFHDLAISRNGKLLNIDSFFIESKYDEKEEKILNLVSNDIKASVEGNFSILNLPNSVQIFLSYYLPQYISVPEIVDVNQQLRFELDLQQTDDLLSIFNENLKIAENSYIYGSLNIEEQELELYARMPWLSYKEWQVDSINIDNVGNYSGLDMKIETGDVHRNQKPLLQDFNFYSRIFKDSSSFHILSKGMENLNETEIKGSAIAERDSFYIKFNPSYFNLNNEKWDIISQSKVHDVVVTPKYVFVDQLKLKSKHQTLTVNSTSQLNTVLVDLDKVRLDHTDFLFQSDAFSLGGRINGSVLIQDFLNEPLLDFNINSNDLVINDDSIGHLQSKGIYDFKNSNLSLEKGRINHQRSSLDFTGDLFSNTLSSERIAAQISLKDAELSWAAPFLKGLVKDLDGKIDGNIQLSGTPANFKSNGLINIKNGQFTPEIIGVNYKINEATISVKNNVLMMDTITLYDQFQNQAFLSGTIQHRQINNWRFNLRLNSDQIEVVNLKSHENDNFYGNVFSTVQSRITGPFENLSMTVVATPTKNSKLFIPIAFNSDLGVYNYIHFKKEIEENEFLIHQKNKMSFRLDAIVNPDIETTILLEGESGDKIWAKGNGNITLNIPSDGEIRMNGNYIIDQGTYDFSFRQLEILNYKRQFTINPNSAIKWNGDVTDADLDVSGYTTIKARLYDLIQSETDRLNLSNSEIRDAQIMQDVNVLLNMQGSLSEPDMKFKIELTEGRSIGTYGYQKLQRINTDERELLNQVASLLLLEQFAPEGINNTALSTGTINNMSELISSAASTQITNFANRLLGVEDLFIGVRYKNYSLNMNNDMSSLDYLNRNEAGINLRKNFFDNRLLVEVGGVYDWGRSTNSNDLTSDIASDFRIQYLLTEDGRIRFNVFRTSNYDALFGQPIGRQGIGIGYRKSFNGLADLFNFRRKASDPASKIEVPKAEDMPKLEK